MTQESALEAINRIAAQLGILSHQPNWHYYKHGPIAFCYNTQPLTPRQETKNRRWAAWKYRVNKRKGTWKQTGKPVYCATRKQAKKRAYAWFLRASSSHFFGG